MKKLIFVLLSIIIITGCSNNKIENTENTKNEEDKNWSVFSGTIDGNQASIRVNTGYIDKKYKNTYFIEIPYSDVETKDLPTQEFIQYVYKVEDKVLDILQKEYPNKIVFLGSSTYGGITDLVFASNLDIEWEKLFKEKLDNTIQFDSLLNDNMDYYNNFLSE